jgi:Ran GTPase-activating protein (RanGAP) involved in mRNA processing and transport
MALQKNKTLKSIYLNDIGLEISTIRSLADCLKKNHTLEELNLGNTGFSDQAARIIWKVLPVSNLKVLHLWNNHLTDISLSEFMDMLEDNTISLDYLGLSDN